MARNGTMQGGKRQGAGRKPGDLQTKIDLGRGAKVLQFGDLPLPTELEGNEMPKVDEWLRDEQENGEKWNAEELVIITYQWLKERDCEKLIPMQQIYAYAVAQSRWIQCQRAISKYGFLAKHPTTKEPMESPYVKMVDKFYKQAASAWFQIFSIVRENSLGDYNGSNPQEEIMAKLLSE